MDKCTECGESFNSRRHSSEFSDEHFWHWFKRDNSPMLTTYDKQNVDKILDGEGDWFSAHVLRFLDKVIWSADSDNFVHLYGAFPEHCNVLLKNAGWTENEISERLIKAGFEVLGNVYAKI